MSTSASSSIMSTSASSSGGDNKRKIISKAEYEYGLSADGKLCVVLYNKETYKNFFLVEHDSALGMEIFKKIQASSCNLRVADSFPSIDTGTSLHFLHRVTATNLRSWIQSQVNSNSLFCNVVPAGVQARPLADNFKLILRDVGLIAHHSVSYAVQMNLTLDSVFVNDSETPQVFAVAASSKSDCNALVCLISVLDEILSYTNNHSEMGAITSSLTLAQQRNRGINQILDSSIFWTNEKKIHVVINLGQFVDRNKYVISLKLKDSDVLRLRTNISADPLLKRLASDFPANNVKSRHSSQIYNREEVDCSVSFLANTLVHFETMCRIGSRTNFRSRVELIIYYDFKYSTVMKQLYEVSKRL